MALIIFCPITNKINLIQYYLIKITILYAIFFSFIVPLYSQKDTTNVSYSKLSVAVTGIGMTSVASYYIVKNAWWSGESVNFHFDDGADLKYAKNVDKIGHIFGGYIVQDVYYDLLKWSNVNERNSLLYSAGMSIFTQFMIDIKDGYAPDWGFSWWDVGAGTAGALYGVIQKKYPVFNDIDLKISYWPRKDKYEANHEWLIEDIIEDYPNQTYWLTIPINQLISGKRYDIFPEFLGLAFGFGIDDGLREWGKGNYEYYLSLDIDLEKISSRYNSAVLDMIASSLNYIKLPSPAIRIKDKIVFYGIYF